jgi:WD40 repeat protein
MESPVGGNVLIPRRSKNQLYVFNEKPGQVNVFDLKMNKVVQSFQLHPNEEVASVTMNEFETTLVAGFKDGTIKIFNIDKDFDLRESFQAFTPLGAKKSVVS